MSILEILQILVRARHEGVELSAKADGKLGVKVDWPPSDELLAALREHKAEIFALVAQLPPSTFAVEQVERTIRRMQALGFRAYPNFAVSATRR